MIDSLYFWTVVLFLSLGTISIRSSFVIASSKFTLSNETKKLFSYIPAAILPAIITPMVVFHQGSIEALYGKERFFILILATLVSYVTKSMITTVGFGLIALYVLTQLF
jgi:branched-subunit amino acid transport protein